MVFKSSTMNINFKDSLAYLTFKELEKYEFIKHAYSSRLGGVSKGIFKSLNLSFSCGDERELVDQNYDIFCSSLGIKKNMIAAAGQVHGNTVACVSKKDLNLSSTGFTCFENTDALITNEPGVVLATYHADCLAVYMMDPKKRIVGLAHAGWRGTVKKIACKLAEKFVSVYGSSKNNIICGLGPCIGSCCFEVSQSVLEEFKALKIPETYIPFSDKEKKLKIDLKEVNKNLLLEFGLNEENIFKSDVCTMCSKDLLFSHRATNGKRGTNGSFIYILN